ALSDLGRQLLARLVRVDRLVLGGVVLEHATQRRDEAEQRQVRDEHRDADQSFDEHEPAAARDRQQVGEQRRADLEDHHGEADRDEEREGERPASELDRLRVAFRFLLRRVVRRDAERTEADREALAERNDAAHDRQPQRPVARGERVDRPCDVGDVAGRRAHGDRPVARSAHHHALEDGLTSDGLRHLLLLRARGALGLLEPALEPLDAAARVHELLLPRVERVAVRADLDVELGARRTRDECVAAAAVHGRELVFGMDSGLHRRARIAAAVAAATLPPETTSTGRSACTRPVIQAAAAAAPAGSHASFARSYRTRNACSISSSETRTRSRSRQISRASRPANGALRPSAIEVGVTGVGAPCSIAVCSAVLVSGSTATTRTRSPIAVWMPEISPPPPTPTITASVSGASSSTSRPTVPAPAITSGSSNGCTSVRPVSAIRSCSRSKASPGPVATRSTVAP